MENLDLVCARFGRDLAAHRGPKSNSKDHETLLTTALGVLEAQGLYAFFLFLEQKKNGGQHHPVTKACAQFLQSHPKDKPLLVPEEDTLYAVSQLAEKLDDLLLAHQLLCRTLVYARHHAKLGESEPPS